jgi:hypothetical protein
VPRGVDPVEALEDPVDLAGRDADPLVRHGQVDHHLVRVSSHDDPPVVG